MTRLALLRHGHTSWNREGRIQGRTDMPLDEAARAHLSGLCLPDDWTAARLVASPLKRAVETAEIIADRAPEQIPSLTEMNWGDWEGKRGRDLKADPRSGYRDIEYWGMAFCPPGGEAIEALVARVQAWATTLEGDTLAVCHIGVMRALLSGPLGWDFLGLPPLAIKRDSLYIIEDGTVLQDPVRLPRRDSCAS